MKRLIIILFLVSLCYGTPFVLLDTTYADVYTSHQLPHTDSALDIGSATYLWRFIYGDAFTDGTAWWESNQLYGFDEIIGTTIVAEVDLIGETITGNNIIGTTITDGTFIVSGGVISAGMWHGTDIDISDYTNLIAGTNITLVDDTLNVDDSFLINDGDDTTTGTLTAGGFTTAGTTITDILIVGSNPPDTITSAGTEGTITYDNDYIYVCIANNSWKRSLLSTWGVAGETMIYEDSNTMLFEDGNTMVYD